MSKYYDAIQQWIKEHQETLDATTLGAERRMNEFLSNRITRAFQDAYNIGFQHGKEEAVERIKKVIME